MMKTLTRMLLCGVLLLISLSCQKRESTNDPNTKSDTDATVTVETSDTAGTAMTSTSDFQNSTMSSTSTSSTSTVTSTNSTPREKSSGTTSRKYRAKAKKARRT
jgi:hypothetical protein